MAFTCTAGHFHMNVLPSATFDSVNKCPEAEEVFCPTCFLQDCSSRLILVGQISKFMFDLANSSWEKKKNLTTRFISCLTVSHNRPQQSLSSCLGDVDVKIWDEWLKAPDQLLIDLVVRLFWYQLISRWRMNFWPQLCTQHDWEESPQSALKNVNIYMFHDKWANWWGLCNMIKWSRAANDGQCGEIVLSTSWGTFRLRHQVDIWMYPSGSTAWTDSTLIMKSSDLSWCFLLCIGSSE